MKYAYKIYFIDIIYYFNKLHNIVYAIHVENTTYSPFNYTAYSKFQLQQYDVILYH